MPATAIMYTAANNLLGQGIPCKYHDQRSQGWRSPESGQDDPLREKQYEQGTPCTNHFECFALHNSISTLRAIFLTTSSILLGHHRAHHQLDLMEHH